MLRAIARAFFAIVTWLILSGSSAVANEDWLETAPAALGPAQLITDAPSGQPVRLDIARFHVNVELMPPVALVQIDQSFYNPAARQDEGIVVLNLPTGASVSRFAVFSDNRLVEAQLIARRYASNVSSSSEREQSDPAFFEHIGDNLFRIPVRAIPARDTKRILLDYTVPLVSDDGVYRFELPLMSDLDLIWDFELTGTLHPPVDNSSITSPTHESLNFTSHADGRIGFDLRQQQVQPQSPFKLEYRPPEDIAASVRSFETTDHDNDGQLWQHLAVTIPSDQSAPPEPPPADVLVLADTSGSMRNMDLLRSAVQTIVRNLRVQDRFQLGCVDASFRPLTNEWVGPDSDAALDVFGELDRQFPLGASQLLNSLPMALNQFNTSDAQRRQIVIYIGDGVGTDDSPAMQWPAALASDGIRFTAAQIGDDPVGRERLQEAVRRTGGCIFQAKHDPYELQPLFAWVRAGLPAPRRIELVEIDGVDPVDLLHDPSWPAGLPLHIYARRRPSTAAVVSLRLADEHVSRRYALAAEPRGNANDVFVGRLWAERKLGALLARERIGVGQDRAQIVKLSQEWSLLTPHTAFLMLNHQADYLNWETNSHLRHRYWPSPRTLVPLAVPERYRNELATSPSEEVTDPSVRTQSDRPLPERFQQGFTAAQAALDAGETGEALRILARLHTWDADFDRERFDQLYTETTQTLANAEFLQSLGLQKCLVNRSALSDLPAGDPALFSLTFGAVSPEFLKHFPYGQGMIRQMRPPREAMSLQEFAAFVQQETGLNVLLDEQNLLDEGISVDAEISLQGLTSITLRNLLNTVLENVDGVALDVVYESDVLLITSAVIAEEKLQTLIYPVSDLVRTDVPLQPALLSDPFREIERAMQHRVRARLQEPVSVHFPGNPLREVVEYFRDFLDTNVRLDEQNLLDEGISPDEEVAISVENVPAGSVLDLLLENVSGVALDWVNEHEIVTITTATIAEERLDTRIYPLSGILYEYPDGIPANSGGTGLWGAGFDPWDTSRRSGRRSSQSGLSRVGPLATDGDDDAADESTAAWDGFGFDDGFGYSSADGAGDTVDFDGIIEIIQNETTGPWFDLDGIGGTISEFENALSIIVRQTERVHGEIEEMLRILRELPQADRTVRPARVPQIAADESPDFDAVIDLVMYETSGPWFDLDGIGGTISEHSPSMSLFIRQTRRNHEEAYSLLAELRQARQVAEHFDETGQLEQLGEYDPYSGPITITQLPTPQEHDQLPPPGEEELALLNTFRAEPAAGSRHWSHDRAVDTESETFTISVQDERLQLTLDDRVLRADGDRAAVAYPTFKFVEFGDWDEAVRQLLDARLPWLPHRSNAELARMFDVTRHAADEHSVTLKLAFPGGAAHLLASFDKQSRRIMNCDACLGDEPQHRLHFHSRDDGPAEVTLEDGDGVVSERWTATDASAAGVLPLRDGWEEYLVDDPNHQVSPVRRARQALQLYDYAGAETILRNALLHQPEQPLLSLTLAWVQEFIPWDELARFGQRQLLEQVVRTADADLVELITSFIFPSLSDRELYFLLLEQPARLRSAENWDRLAQLALQQGRHAEALEHLKTAIAATDESNASALRERNLDRIHILLLLQRDADADTAAEQLLAEQGASAMLLAQLGDRFGAAGHVAAADSFFARALDFEDQQPAEQHHFLTQQAQWHAGATRWRLLLRAAELLPPDNQQRQYVVSILRSEMITPIDADAAGQLSGETVAADIGMTLKLRQAELTANPVEAAEIAVSLFQAQQLPSDRFEWLIERLIHAGRYDEAIDILEESLRAGDRLHASLRRHLAAAYAAAGRHQDGLRSDSQTEEERKPPTPPQPPRGGIHGFGFGGSGSGFGGGGGFFSVEDAP